METGTLEEFFAAQAEWSRSVFGADHERGPAGPLKHLAKEVVEAQANPGDLMEYVDCLFLVFDSCRRAGFNLEQLREGCWRKLAINKSRTWQKPTSDEPVEHVRDEARQVMPRVDGVSFRCECGCNVFTEIGTKRYRCNSCDATYQGE